MIVRLNKAQYQYLTMCNKFSNYLYNVNLENNIENISHRSIAESFIWGNTSEGYDFWKYVHNLKHSEYIYVDKTGKLYDNIVY
jgi:hypothetical protein